MEILKWIIIIVVLAVYPASYIAWSRIAIALSHQEDSEGYYFLPLSTDPQRYRTWERNERLIQLFYAPAIFIDVHIFHGQSPSSAPMMGLS